MLNWNWRRYVFGFSKFDWQVALTCFDVASSYFIIFFSSWTHSGKGRSHSSKSATPTVLLLKEIFLFMRRNFVPCSMSSRLVMGPASICPICETFSSFGWQMNNIGATTLSRTTFNTTTFSITTLKITARNATFSISSHVIEGHYAGCRFLKCRYAESRGATISTKNDWGLALSQMNLRWGHPDVAAVPQNFLRP